MAEKDKIFYWLKLKSDLMNGEVIDFLMSQKNGAEYVVLYQMLALKTINTKGILGTQIGEVIIPFDPHKIQRDCKWFSLDTVIVALELYKKLGLVYKNEDNLLQITNFEDMVGSETYWAKQKRIQNARKVEILEQKEECWKISNDSPTKVQNPLISNIYNLNNNNKENNKEKEYKEKESMLNENELFPDVEVESGSMITAESQIFDFWNECNIIKHREMTDNIKKAITKALKTYTREDICKYIKRYAIVLEDDKYFFNYKWTLIDFLNRKDGISSFSDEGSKWINFVNATGYTEKEQAVEEVSYEDKESF